MSKSRSVRVDVVENPVEVLKVSSRSSPNAVAGAMAGVVRSAGVVEVQVVGAGALNQAIKAIAIARGYLAPSGLDVVTVPTFADIEIDGQSRTAIRLTIEDRHRRRLGGAAADGHHRELLDDEAEIDLRAPSPNGDSVEVAVAEPADDLV